MGEPPDLSRGLIGRVLLAGYGVEVAELAFLDVGDDSDSWSYRVGAGDGSSWFLKVRTGGDRAPGAVVPAELGRLGVPAVLAPLTTAEGTATVAAGGFALALYPVVEGTTAAEAGLTAAQWRQLGAAVRRLHGVALTPALDRVVRRERFRPTRRELLPKVAAALGRGPAPDRVAARLARFWRDHREVIAELVGRADALGARLAGQGRPRVLCHADLHGWNVLVDAERRLWIVDWDETTHAPKERDLMFVVGGIGHGLVGPDDTAAFLDGYGETTVDPDLLAYYRHAWAVQDIAAYAERALLLPGLGPATRAAAVAGLEDLFAPGNIVDLALDRGKDR
jgi:spectinomycin phosphotransferase